MSEAITGHVQTYKAKPARLDADGHEIEPPVLVVQIEVPLSDGATALLNDALLNGHGIRANPMQLSLEVG